ncbi:MAG: IclR family mhp operon transcriptional activator [Paracoccaceae bacterium]|jgi:IclR family mhp operon transcriptional activator
MAEDTKRIRALDRGMAVVEHLAKTGRTSLSSLRAETGLSNATLLRILATMQDRNWVRRSVVDAKYELSNVVGQKFRAGKYAHPIAEAAAPIMCELRDAGLQYPSDLLIPLAPGVIEVIETTRPRGPHAPFRPPYGVRPSMVFSAHGRAILAFSDPGQREAHLSAITISGTHEEKRWLKDGRLQAALEEARKCGFGVRANEYWANNVDDVPETGAIAYPIFLNRSLVASLSILWLESEKSLADILAENTPAIYQRSVQKISLAIQDSKIHL